MKKLRCLIVDDEPVARKVLREFVEQVPTLQLAGQFENVAKTEAFLRSDSADLMFLDIEMPRRTGLEYLKSASEKPMVILTTAFPNYALEGYELDVIDYLLKPVAFSRFLKAVQKASEYAGMRNAADGPVADYLFVRADQRIEKVGFQEILYVESLGNYVVIHAEGRKLVVYLTLKGLEAQLPSAQFLRVHQSYLVAAAKIEAIEGNTLNVGGRALPIGKSHKAAVMKWVEQRMLRR